MTLRSRGLVSSFTVHVPPAGSPPPSLTMPFPSDADIFHARFLSCSPTGRSVALASSYDKRLRGSYTFEIVQFNAFQGFFEEVFKAILAMKKHKNYRPTAPPSGLVRSSSDHGRMMRYLRDEAFTRTIFTSFDVTFTHFEFDTSLMPQLCK